MPAPRVAVAFLALAVCACSLQERYTREAELLVPRAELKEFFQQGELAPGTYDHREEVLAFIDGRRGVLRMGTPGAWQTVSNPRLQGAVRITLGRSECIVATWKPASMKLEFFKIEQEAPRGKTLVLASVASFQVPQPVLTDTNDSWAPPDLPFHAAHASDRGGVLYHLDSGKQQGVLVLDKAGRLSYLPFPASLTTNQGHFQFQTFRLGWREELAYAVYVQTSRRGIEKALVCRLELPSGRVRGRTTFVCDPEFFFDVVDDAEAVFTRYDEGNKQFRFEYRNLDNGKSRLAKVFEPKAGLPPDLRFERKGLVGTLYETDVVRFVSWR